MGRARVVRIGLPQHRKRHHEEWHPAVAVERRARLDRRRHVDAVRQLDPPLMGLGTDGDRAGAEGQGRRDRAGARVNRRPRREVPHARAIEEQNPRQRAIVDAEKLAADACPTVEPSLNPGGVGGGQLAGDRLVLPSTRRHCGRQRSAQHDTRGEMAQRPHDEPHSTHVGERRRSGEAGSRACSETGRGSGPAEAGRYNSARASRS